MKSVILCLSLFLVCVAGQRITTIQLDGVQYYVSRMNPYSPELNYFLAYQYCRSLGLQLASFETKEKVESMTQYLQNAGYSKYDFWTSGNRLGTGMFLWMSSGLPFNATFDYFVNQNDATPSDLDPLDHNSNTSPQRTARDSTSGLDKGCVILKAPTLRWTPQDCSAVKDFICEQTRCYYYNYGSIPVSSAQGRPIITTQSPVSTTTGMMSSTPLYITSTPLPLMLSSTYSTFIANKETEQPELEITNTVEEGNQEEESEETEVNEPRKFSDDIVKTTEEEAVEHEDEEETQDVHGDDSTHNDEEEEENPVTHEDVHENETETEENHENTEASEESVEHHTVEDETTPEHEIPVEQKLKQITEEITKYSNVDNAETDTARQSFLSLTDLIKTLRTNENKKVLPAQIDSDYSNTMRVLGDQTSMNSDSRQFKDSEVTKINNRSLN